MVSCCHPSSNRFLKSPNITSSFLPHRLNSQNELGSFHHFSYPNSKTTSVRFTLFIIYSCYNNYARLPLPFSFFASFSFCFAAFSSRISFTTSRSFFFSSGSWKSRYLSCGILGMRFLKSSFARVIDVPSSDSMHVYGILCMSSLKEF